MARTAAQLLAAYEACDGQIPPALRFWLIGLLEGAHPDPKFDLVDMLNDVVR